MRFVQTSLAGLLVSAFIFAACGSSGGSGNSGDGDGDLPGDGDGDGDGDTGGNTSGDGDGDGAGAPGDGDGDGTGGGNPGAQPTYALTLTSALGTSTSFEVTFSGAIEASCNLDDSPCYFGADPGLTAMLTPADVPPYATVTWTGCDSVEEGVCTVSADEDIELTAHLELLGNLIFITDMEFQGNLGGHDGASAKCQAAADAASLPGTFVAVLHDGTSGPDLSTEDGPLAQGFISPAGDYIAHTADQILGGDFNRLIPNESGTSPGYRPVWLNLDNDGEEMGSDCDGFTSSATGPKGDIFYSRVIGRKDSTQLGCQQDASLLCVATDGVYDLDVPGVDKTNDYVFFLSENPWQPWANGRAAADQICDGQANTAGLAGTYQAYLSVDGKFAGERINANKTYVRGDGTPFVSTPVLISGEIPTGHSVPLNIHADGSSTLEDVHAFIGNVDTANCNDFTTYLSGSSTVGRVNYPLYSLSDISTRTCVLENHLYCFRAY